MEKNIKMAKLITICAVVLIFVSIIILTFQFVKIGNIKSQTAQLQHQKQHLIQEIYEYNSANNFYNNNRSEYLEDYARENLGWGTDGEIWYTYD